MLKNKKGKKLQLYKAIFNKLSFKLKDSYYQENSIEMNYAKCPLGFMQHFTNFLIVLLVGTLVAYVFYRNVIISVVIGIISGLISIPINIQNSIIRRKKTLRNQFQHLLEALDVALRAGENVPRALKSSQDSLQLVYNSDSDIIIEVKMMLLWLKNGKTLREIFRDFANRCQLQEVEDFAAVFEVIEGKGDNEQEIVNQTQEIIRDTIEVEMEIETIMTEMKNELIIMLILPVVIIGVISAFGGEIMKSIHTTVMGRVISTISLIIFGASYFIARKIADINL